MIIIMRHLLFLILFICSISLHAKPKIESKGLIVAGDSWAYLPCFFNVVYPAFVESGIDVNVVGCQETSQPGARAENYKNSKAYFEVISLLKKYSHIKAIHLSLGGNDMFRGWNKNMSEESEQILFNEIRSYVKEVAQDFINIKSDIKILVNGYDYGYQYDNNPVKPYREIYEKMGKPTPEEVNQGFLRFSKAMAELKNDKIFYIHHHGLMHYHFGVPEVNVKPGNTLVPSMISSVDNPLQFGGIISARNAPEAMARISGLYVDPHHLGIEGYDKLIRHNIENYFKYWFK